MPEEYVFIGRWIASPRPENSMISSLRSLISRREKPSARQPRVMFRSPDRLGSRAASTPSSVGGATDQTWPRVIGTSPATARSSVLLPEPLRPMMPTASPRRTTADTERTACTVSVRPRRAVATAVEPFLRFLPEASTVTSKSIWTWSMITVGGGG